MKKFLAILFLSVGLVSCVSTVSYEPYFGKMTDTRVVLSHNNFKVLGHFTGQAIAKITTNFKHSEGLLSKARKDLIKQAEKAGYPLTGSRTFINTSIDYIKTEGYVKAIISADLIEFTGK